MLQKVSELPRAKNRRGREARQHRLAKIPTRSPIKNKRGSRERVRMDDRPTFEFLYGICFSPFSPFSANAAMTSPNALRLRLMFWVSFRRSLSPAAPLEFSRSLPARSTRLRLPSHRSPVCSLHPEMRRVKTECDRDERSFISVAATVRREFASRKSAVTSRGVRRGITLTSVTRVVALVAVFSCLISCFFLSNSPFPSRSLIVSLYCVILRSVTSNRGNETENGGHLQFPRTVPPCCTSSLCSSVRLQP